MYRISQLENYVELKHHKSPTLLDESYKYCEQIIEENSKSFSFSANFLDEETKKSVVALYAFCRMVDDLVDETDLDPKTITTELDILQEDLSNVYLNDKGHEHILLAFGDTIRKHDIPIKYVNDLIEGVKMDINHKRIRNFDELYLYSYRVASTVGLMMTHIFIDDPEEEVLSKATSMGIAMQITNILRDIKEDYEMGRVYLPADMMTLYDVKLEDLANNQPTNNLVELITHLISIAREYYDLGYEGVKLLPPGPDFVVELAGRIYGEILDEIERADYLVLDRRVYVSKLRKIWIAFKLRIKYRSSLKKARQINS